jgi:serine/threonine-protein kinase
VRELHVDASSIAVAVQTARLANLPERADALIARARTVDYPPALAEAWLARGDVATALGDPTRAETAYYEAVWAAQAGRDGRAAVEAWTKLVVAVGVEQARTDEGVRLLHHADAALRGLGTDHRLRALLELGAAKLHRNRNDFAAANAAIARARVAMASEPDEDRFVRAKIENIAGTIAYAVGNYDDALARYQQAYDLLVRALGAQHPDVARALNNIGNVYKDREDYDRALEYYERARELVRAVMPEVHPLVAAIEGNIGLTLMELHKTDDALAHQRKALDIEEKIYGSVHPDVARELNNIGLQLVYAKRPREAVPYFERARDLFTKLSGPEHLDVAMCEHNLALAYLDLREDVASEAHWRRAIAIRARVAPDHPELARSLTMLAGLLTRSQRFDESAQLIARAIAIYEKAHGPNNPLLAKPLLDLGWIRNRQHRYAEAIPPLERVIPIHEATKDPLVAVSRLELADALWSSNRDRPRAIELAKAARSALDPKAQHDDVAEIDAWLASHRL